MQSSKNSQSSVGLPRQKSNARVGLWTGLLVFVATIPAMLQIWIVSRQEFAFPYQDDYTAVLAFALGYTHLHGSQAHLLYLVQTQYNEYKLIFEHLVIGLELALDQQIKFPLLNRIGNMFILLIGGILWKILRVEGESLNEALTRFIPVSFIFFSLTYWETVDWAMASLQNLPVVFWGLLSLYLLNTQKNRFGWRFPMACVAGILAASSSGNGLLLLPVGLLGLVPIRAYKQAAVWCCCFCLPIAAYVRPYFPVMHVVKRRAVLTRPLLFLTFLGDAILYRWFAVLLGLVVLVISLRIVQAWVSPRTAALTLPVIWILSTAALVAWARGGAGFQVASRYSIYSNLLLVFCLSFLNRHSPDRRLSSVGRPWFRVSIVTVLFCLCTDYYANEQLSARRLMVANGIAFYEKDPAKHSPMVDPIVEKSFPEEKDHERLVLTESIREGIYKLPIHQHLQAREWFTLPQQPRAKSDILRTTIWRPKKSF